MEDFEIWGGGSHFFLPVSPCTNCTLPPFHSSLFYSALTVPPSRPLCCAVLFWPLTQPICPCAALCSPTSPPHTAAHSLRASHMICQDVHCHTRFPNSISEAFADTVIITLIPSFSCWSCERALSVIVSLLVPGSSLFWVSQHAKEHLCWKGTWGTNWWPGRLRIFTFMRQRNLNSQLHKNCVTKQVPPPRPRVSYHPASLQPAQKYPKTTLNSVKSN